MIFAGTEIAQRIERAECGLVEESTAALARAGTGEAFVIPIAGGVAAFSGPDSPLTKVTGIGLAGVSEEADLELVESEFRARGSAVQVELSTLAASGIAERLTARGYRLVGFENVLGRTLDPSLHFDERIGITVEPSPERELDTWIAVVLRAFGTPDTQGVGSHEAFPDEALERVLRGLAGTSGLVRLLALRAGEPAGAASFRISSGIAQLCGAGTLPVHRRRGVQAALLERRLAVAARTGCDLAIVTTLPGSKSQQNVQRFGFEILYGRAILRLPAPP